MSLAESGESTGEASLASLLDGADCSVGTPPASDTDVVEALCRGGWPRHLTMGVAQAQALCRAYPPQNRSRWDIGSWMAQDTAPNVS